MWLCVNNNELFCLIPYIRLGDYAVFIMHLYPPNPFICWVPCYLYPFHALHVTARLQDKYKFFDFGNPISYDIRC